MIQLNGETLAYIGDGYYEHKIRLYLISQNLTKVNILHKSAITFTSAIAQAKIVDYLLGNNLLSEDEIAVYKRGRNSNHSANRRKIAGSDYRKSTGFEALLGFLVLSNLQDRADEIVTIAIKIIKDVRIDD